MNKQEKEEFQKNLANILGEYRILDYICIPFTGKTIRVISSAGSEHLPYKQGVVGSNPTLPTEKAALVRLFAFYAIPGINFIPLYPQHRLSHSCSFYIA
jgi:hypothetical protein